MRELARQYLDDINVHVPSVDAEAEQLSGGQRQAIAVARAMRAATKILLLDEPLAAMGARESRLIIDLVKDLARAASRVDRRHRPQLRTSLRALRPHQRHAGGPHHHRPTVHDTSLEKLTELMVSSYHRQLEDTPSAGA